MATIWTFEPQIEQIYSVARRKDEEYCPGFRKSSRMANEIRAMRIEDARTQDSSATENEEIKEEDIKFERAGLEYLLAIETLDELQKMASPIGAA
jgi:hypothetical protein